MTNKVEEYKSITLDNGSKSTFFGKFTYAMDGKTDGHIRFTPLFLEIKTSEPPTDCVLHFSYTQENNVLQSSKIELIKYRRDFVFENGYYTLYLENVSELQKDINFNTMTFENTRDTNSQNKLYVRINFLQRQQ